MARAAGSGLLLRTQTSPGADPPLLTRGVPAYVVAPAGCSARTPSTPRTRRCSARSRGCASTRASPWPTCAARSTPSPPRCSARASSPGCGRPTSPSPSPAPSWTCSASPAAAPPRAGRRAVPGLPQRGLDRDRRLRHGQPGRAGRLRRRPRALHAASPSAWAWTAPLMFRHGITDIRDLYEGDVALHAPPSGWRPDMRVPVSWLRALVPGLTASADEIAAALVRAGLEVEQVHRVRRRRLRRGRRPRCSTSRSSTGFKKPIRFCHVRRRQRASTRSSAAPRTSPPATGCPSPCPARCCPAASRSPPGRPTAAPPTG